MPEIKTGGYIPKKEMKLYPTEKYVIKPKIDTETPAGKPEITVKDIKPEEAVESAEKGLEDEKETKNLRELSIGKLYQEKKKGIEKDKIIDKIIDKKIKEEQRKSEKYKEIQKELNGITTSYEAIKNSKETDVLKAAELLKTQRDKLREKITKITKEKPTKEKIEAEKEEGFVLEGENFITSLESNQEKINNPLLHYGKEFFKSVQKFLIKNASVNTTPEAVKKAIEYIDQGKNITEAYDLINKEEAKKDFTKYQKQVAEQIDIIAGNLKDFDNFKHKDIAQNIKYIEKTMLPDLDKVVDNKDFSNIKEDIEKMQKTVSFVKEGLKAASLNQEKWAKENKSIGAYFNQAKMFFKSFFEKGALEDFYENRKQKYQEMKKMNLEIQTNIQKRIMEFKETLEKNFDNIEEIEIREKIEEEKPEEEKKEAETEKAQKITQKELIEKAGERDEIEKKPKTEKTLKITQEELIEEAKKETAKEKDAIEIKSAEETKEFINPERKKLFNEFFIEKEDGIGNKKGLKELEQINNNFPDESNEYKISTLILLNEQPSGATNEQIKRFLESSQSLIEGEDKLSKVLKPYFENLKEKIEETIEKTESVPISKTISPRSEKAPPLKTALSKDKKVSYESVSPKRAKTLSL